MPIYKLFTLELVLNIYDILIGSIAQCLSEHSQILRAIDDQGIGWCHHDVGIRMLLLDLPAGISNTWSGIAEPPALLIYYLLACQGFAP